MGIISSEQLTCARAAGGGGLQRRFLSGAGAKLPDGLFFTTMTTPPDSALSFSTRCFSCQPTWTNHRQEHANVRKNRTRDNDVPGEKQWNRDASRWRWFGLTTVCLLTCTTSSPA